jgi:hypothetical protein
MIATLIAVAEYHSHIVNLVLTMMWSFLAMYNGGNFYVESFTKSYERNLKKIEELRLKTLKK